MASDLTGQLVIGDHNWLDHVQPIVDGEHKSRGLIPRNFSTHHRGCYGAAQAVDIPLIPRSEWSARIKAMEDSKTRLSDIRLAGNFGNHIPALDQNGQGFCWSYSSTCAVQLLNAVANKPYVALSAHSVACVIKNFRDEGGWGALSLDFIMTRGIVPQSLWPAKAMNRQYDTPANWAEAKQFRTTEGWIDMADPVYDRNLTFDQVATCLLSRIPVVCDFNWWGHSVCAMDLVETSPGKYGLRILNSWTDNWGTLGAGVLEGSKAIPDGAVAPRVVAGA